MDSYAKTRHCGIHFLWGLLFLLTLCHVGGEEPPYVMRDNETGEMSGLLVDVLKSAKIPIDIHTAAIRDIYGWEQQPGKFIGMIGDLIDGKYDLAVAPFTIKSSRAKSVAFTQPILHHGYRALYQLPSDNNEMHINMDAMATLLKPFSPGLWCVIILTGVLATVVLYFIRRYSPYEDHYDDVSTTTGTLTSSSRADNSLATMTSWGSGLMYLMGSLTGRNASVTPRSTSGRILTGVWWVFSLMTVAAYIAGLVVVLFKEDPHVRGIPFATVEEMVSQTKVKILGVRKSSTVKYVSDHPGLHERLIYKYWKDRGSGLLVDSVSEALKMMREGDGRYAMFLDEALATYMASEQPCNKMVIGEAVGDVAIGFACQKNSTVCSDMDHVILALKEEGKIERLKEKYFKSGCHMSSEIYFAGRSYFDAYMGKTPGLLSPNSVTLRRFSSAFIVLFIGLAIALMVLGAEVIYSRRKGVILHRQLKNVGRDEDAQIIQDHEFSPGLDA